MPLCLGASGSVRARQIAQSACRACDVQTFCPLSSHPPAARHRPGAQRREVGSGARLGEQLAPDDVAPQGRADEGLPLLVGAVGQDRGQRPVADGGRGLGQAGPRELLGDHHLGGRARADAVRPRVVRRRQPALGQEAAPLVRRQRRRLGQRLAPPRAAAPPTRRRAARRGGVRRTARQRRPAAAASRRAGPAARPGSSPGASTGGRRAPRCSRCRRAASPSPGRGRPRRAPRARPRPPPPARTARRPGRGRRRRPRRRR